MKKNAFTLIELLAVIVIIAILIAFLYPAISKAKEQGRSAKCVSNLKQLQIAAMNYIMDNSGNYPSAASSESKNPDSGDWSQTSKGWVDWVGYTIGGQGAPTPWRSSAGGLTSITNGSLYSYVGNVSIYVCPTFISSSVCGVSDAVRSYGMNSQISGLSTYTLSVASRIMTFSDQSPLTTETWDKGTGSTYGLNSGAWTDSSTSGRLNNRQMDGMIEARDCHTGLLNIGQPYEHIGGLHNGCANCVFLDGHVEKIYYTNTISVCDGNWAKNQ